MVTGAAGTPDPGSRCRFPGVCQLLPTRLSCEGPLDPTAQLPVLLHFSSLQGLLRSPGPRPGPHWEVARRHRGDGGPVASEAPRELVRVDSWALSPMFDSGTGMVPRTLFQGCQAVLSSRVHATPRPGPRPQGGTLGRAERAPLGSRA